jgi:hypothetical protein
MIPRRRPTPITSVVKFGQDEKRQRRRQHLVVAYDGAFSLADEVAAITGPLARRVTDRPDPLVFRRWVIEFADAVHEAASTVVSWVAEIDARRVTEHLAAEPGKRTYAIRKIVDLAQRPALPELSDTALTTGRWPAGLVTMVEPVSVQLSDLLARAFPPNDDRLRGTVSRSELVVELLRETIDRAALALNRRLDWAESQPAPRRSAPADAIAELADLGVVIP